MREALDVRDRISRIIFFYVFHMSNYSEIRIQLEDRPLLLPYPATESSEEVNYGYKSIVSEPSLIDQIPEIADESAMRNLIAAINGPNGIFETIRVTHWFYDRPQRRGRAMALGLIFRDRKLFSQYQNCIIFSGNILNEIRVGSIVSDEATFLQIQPCVLTEESSAQGFVMDLYMSGFGDSDDSARQRLDQIIPAWTDFLHSGQSFQTA